MLSAFPRPGNLPLHPLQGPEMTDSAPAAQLDLARQLNALPSEQRPQLRADWTARYGADVAYQIEMEAVYLIVWPEAPAEFRAQWTAPTVNRPDIRAAVAVLTDEELEKISSSLRWTQAQHPDEVSGIWELAILMAGVA